MAGLLACVLWFTFPQHQMLQWSKHNYRHSAVTRRNKAYSCGYSSRLNRFKKFRQALDSLLIYSANRLSITIIRCKDSRKIEII